MADNMNKNDLHDQKAKSSGQQDDNLCNCEPENDSNKAEHNRLIIELEDLSSEEVTVPKKEYDKNK